MDELFELEWLGGVAEKHYRRLRPDVAALPWGSLDAHRFPPALVERARGWWHQVVLGEYRASITFSQLLRDMLEAKAPLDLIGMASDFVADEVSHVELASRIAMELGGGVPLRVDTCALLWPASSALSPLQKASERVVRHCCVHETLSATFVTRAMRASTHPLLRGAETIIARDEAGHTRLGSLYLEWVADRLDDEERRRLAGVAVATLTELSPLWKRPACRLGASGRTRDGDSVEQLHELGAPRRRQRAAHRPGGDSRGRRGAAVRGRDRHRTRGDREDRGAGLTPRDATAPGEPPRINEAAASRSCESAAPRWSRTLARRRRFSPTDQAAKRERLWAPRSQGPGAARPPLSRRLQPAHTASADAFRRRPFAGGTSIALCHSESAYLRLSARRRGVDR
jgi:hypothetical protein